VAHVVQVDFGQARLCRNLLEPTGDGVSVRRLAVLPTEEPAAIVVIRPELFSLGVELAEVQAAAVTTDLAEVTTALRATVLGPRSAAELSHT
jgi:hypothetical protein